MYILLQKNNFELKIYYIVINNQTLGFESTTLPFFYKSTVIYFY